MGYQPTHLRGKDWWYRSPLRPDERTPSFVVDSDRNYWYDHGAGQGGTIIDFVQQVYHTNDIKRVLEIIDDVGHGLNQIIVTPSAQPRIIEPRPKPVIDRVGDIEDTMLERYVRDRGIPLELARMYLKEIHYHFNNRKYSALGFPNDSAGFEIRNAHFQGTIGNKDITYLAQADRRDVAVFEGFFDFLSTLALYHRDSVPSNVLVLNSVSLLEQGMRKMQEQAIEQVYAYLDNDPAGVEATRLLTEQDWRVRDMSSKYQAYKDIAEYWQKAGQGRDR